MGAHVEEHVYRGEGHYVNEHRLTNNEIHDMELRGQYEHQYQNQRVSNVMDYTRTSQPSHVQTREIRMSGTNRTVIGNQSGFSQGTNVLNGIRR